MGDASAIADNSAIASARSTLAFLAHVDVIVELIAQRVGGRNAVWQSVAVVEAARAVLRLWLLTQRRGGILLRGGTVASPACAARWWRGGLSGISVPCLTPAAHDSDASQFRSPLQLVSLVVAAVCDVAARPMPRSDVSREPTAATTALDATLMDGVDCESAAEPLRTLGELLFTLRPLVMLAASAALGPRSWLPWVLSASMDVAADRCAVVAVRQSCGENASFVPTIVRDPLVRAFARLLTPQQQGLLQHSRTNACQLPADTSDITDSVLAAALSGRDCRMSARLLRLVVALFALPPDCPPHVASEIHRRRLLWTLYLLRAPLVASVSRPLLGSACDGAARVPLLGPLLAYAMNAFLSALDASQSSYFVTAGSQ